MRTVAVYSLKGGVGKTTLAVNLACAAALHSSRRTLLWDLDAQSAASFLLGANSAGASPAQAVFENLLPADASLRGLDRFLFGLGKKKRLLRLIAELGRDYERIVLDAPPGLTETSEQVLRAADLILVPVIPSPLSQRALDEVVAHLERHHGRRAAILPVYNMVDRRRSIHLTALAAHPEWPAIPMASAFETMSAAPAGVGRLPAGSPAETALMSLWRGIEKRLARAPKSGSR